MSGDGADAEPVPLSITTPEALPEAIAGRPYAVALAAAGRPRTAALDHGGELARRA